MDWNDVARQVIARGAPVLGAALGGPLGGAAGAILAEALGGAPANPNDLHDAINPPSASVPDATFAQAEEKWIDLLRAQAEEARVVFEQSHETIRREMASGDVLQRWWRPIYAFELTLECALLWSAIVRGLWLGDVTAINAMIGATALLVAYWAFRFGVLGVYVHGRTQEKLREAAGVVAGARLPSPGTRKST